MTRVDLDAIEATARTAAPDGWVRTYVPPLVAELRAAREVVEAARRIRGVFTEDGPLARSVDAYDRAVGA
jgi:hypothetical protein